MLVHQTNPVEVQLVPYVNTFFSSNKFAWDTCLKTLIEVLNLMQVTISYGKTRCLPYSAVPICGGSVAEWFRALDLKSGGPWFKFSTLPLSGFVLGSPEFNPSTALCK